MSEEINADDVARAIKELGLTRIVDEAGGREEPEPEQQEHKVQDCGAYCFGPIDLVSPNVIDDWNGAYLRWNCKQIRDLTKGVLKIDPEIEGFVLYDHKEGTGLYADAVERAKKLNKPFNSAIDAVSCVVNSMVRLNNKFDTGELVFDCLDGLCVPKEPMQFHQVTNYIWGMLFCDFEEHGTYKWMIKFIIQVIRGEEDPEWTIICDDGNIKIVDKWILEDPEAYPEGYVMGINPLEETKKIYDVDKFEQKL